MDAAKYCRGYMRGKTMNKYPILSVEEILEISGNWFKTYKSDFYSDDKLFSLPDKQIFRTLVCSREGVVSNAVLLSRIKEHKVTIARTVIYGLTNTVKMPMEMRDLVSLGGFIEKFNFFPTKMAKVILRPFNDYFFKINLPIIDGYGEIVSYLGWDFEEPDS